MDSRLNLQRVFAVIPVLVILIGGNCEAATLFTKSSKFLLFPNPLVEADGTSQTNTEAYARAYYEAIDPQNERDALEKWKARNYASPSEEHHVIFGDTHDLGYGRDMTVWKNGDGSIAAYVRNFQVSGYSKANYNHLNLVAAIKNATKKYHVGTNAIEYSAGPNGGAKFVKFYNFDPRTGERNLMVDLDGLGKKAMPGVCISCHGGRADPLTPPSDRDILGNDISSNPKPLFALAQNSFSQHRGDVQARMQPFKVDTFDYAPEFPGFSRAELEPKLKAINKLVLCTYPILAATAYPEDTCRPVLGTGAGYSEWWGTAADFIKAAYGGDGLPNTNYSDTYVPDSWVTNGKQVLYREVVGPACMTCHMVRGSGNMADIDFTAYDFSFMGGGWVPIDYGLPYLPNHFSYLDRIKAHVFDRGNMPLAKIVSDEFWLRKLADGKVMAEKLADYLEDQFDQLVSNIKTALGATDEDLENVYQVPASVSLHDGKGKVLRPGRPVAGTGPDRVVPKNTPVKLWNESLYAKSYKWTIVSADGVAPDVNTVWLSSSDNPAAAKSLTSNVANPWLTSSASGNTTYKIALVAINGKSMSEPRTLRVAVNDSLFADSATAAAHPESYPKPADIRFSHIKYRLQNLTCTSCHFSGQNPVGSGVPPIFYDDYDRDGVGGVDATDDFWFYKELRGRVNFSEVAASPLLRKPSGHHHNGGGPFGGTDLSTAPGYSDPAALASKADRTTYDLFVNWIVNGAPFE
jgi:mono/diheme cytochrome c family protein